MSLLFVDLDNFKSINYGFGYAYGDLLLKQVGQRLQAAISAQDRVARVGGDEFAVLVPESQQAALKQRCRAIHAELTRPYMINGLRFETGCSIGIARMQEAGQIGRASCRERVYVWVDDGQVKKRRHGDKERLTQRW